MTSTTPSATALSEAIVDVLTKIRTTQGIPQATQERCDHSLRSVHESIHGLTLWLRELLEWAPLSPETRARVIRVAHDLGYGDAGFHRSLDNG